jgi:protein-S-isoprenylcysteine O-methyltransferase Ste14
MFVLARAVTYATLFIGFVLVALPAQVLRASGIQAPGSAGPMQLAGAAVSVLGASVALACIITFVVVGQGTPAPFDPPRRLVVTGPYRWVRNPMYLSAAIAMAGAALYYESAALGGYVGVFLAVMQVFVVVHEEPTLRRSFEGEYDAYCHHVRRWLPSPR